MTIRSLPKRRLHLPPRRAGRSCPEHAGSRPSGEPKGGQPENRNMLALDLYRCNRANAIHANAFSSMIDGHGFGQSDNSTFCRAIGCAARLGKESVHRGNVDDAALGLSQLGKKMLGAQKDAPQVNTYFPIPLLIAGMLYRFINLNRGIVYQDVDA